MKDGSDSQWSGLFLRLTAVSVASNGSYTCVANNTVQSVLRKAYASVLLIVGQCGSHRSCPFGGVNGQSSIPTRVDNSDMLTDGVSFRCNPT